LGGKGKCWSGIVVGSVGWGALPQIMMGFLVYYWLIGISDAHGKLLVMLLSLAIHVTYLTQPFHHCDTIIQKAYWPVELR
jgi:hypothetical protein